jgi:dephospho-CoA kinase
MRQAFLEQHRDAPLIGCDIPLRVENGGSAGLDAVAVVSAPANVQRERVLARPGMTAEKFENILGLQIPDAEKRRRADHVIATGVSHQATRQQVRQLIACLLNGKER